MLSVRQRTKVTQTTILQLRNGKRVLLAELDVSYLELVHLGKLLASNQVKCRKRRKHGSPLLNREMVIWLVSAAGENVRLAGSLESVAPLEAPASVGLKLPGAAAVCIGSVLEFEVRECVSE